MPNPHQSYKPGDYSLGFIGIVGTSGIKEVISDQVSELNIYQSIDSPCMTGSIVITDNSGLAETLPIIGQERLIFVLETPGLGKGSAVRFDEHHAIISNISDRFTTTEHSHTYRLEFVTVETYTNARTKVSQSYNGEIDSMVADIFRDKNYLNSKKRLFIEPTRDVKTYVAPNLRPFQVIRHLADQAISKEDGHSGYLFFETSQGYHFRSFESLMGKNKSGTLTPTSKVYKSQPAPDTSAPAEKRKDSILDMRLINSLDTLGSTKAGLFGSTLIYHDIFNKNVIKKKFSYFDDTPFTSVLSNQQSFRAGTIASDAKIGDNKNFGDYPESRIFLHPTSSDNLHTKGIDNNADEWLQTSASRYYEQDYFQLQMLTYGDTSVNAGDMVYIQIPTNQPVDKGSGPAAYDTLMSGRYLIADLKHSIDPKAGMHGMTLKLIKDSVSTRMPSEDFDFPEAKGASIIPITSSDYRTPEEVNTLQAKL